MCARRNDVRRANGIKSYRWLISPELWRMLSNALIQPHFDYACPSWYPNLTEKTKKKIQIMQDKCIRFCLRLDKVHHISEEDFRLINWLPTRKRVDQCILSILHSNLSITLVLIIWKKFLNLLHILE